MVVIGSCKILRDMVKLRAIYQYMWKYPNQDIFPDDFMYADLRITVRVVA